MNTSDDPRETPANNDHDHAVTPSPHPPVPSYTPSPTTNEDDELYTTNIQELKLSLNAKLIDDYIASSLITDFRNNLIKKAVKQLTFCFHEDVQVGIMVQMPIVGGAGRENGEGGRETEWFPVRRYSGLEEVTKMAITWMVLIAVFDLVVVLTEGKQVFETPHATIDFNYRRQPAKLSVTGKLKDFLISELNLRFEDEEELNKVKDCLLASESDFRSEVYPRLWKTSISSKRNIRNQINAIQQRPVAKSPNPSPHSNLALLPIELLQCTTVYLHPKDLLRLSLSCKRLRTIIAQNLMLDPKYALEHVQRAFCKRWYWNLIERDLNTVRWDRLPVSYWFAYLAHTRSCTPRYISQLLFCTKLSTPSLETQLSDLSLENSETHPWLTYLQISTTDSWRDGELSDLHVDPEAFDKLAEAVILLFASPVYESGKCFSEYILSLYTRLNHGNHLRRILQALPNDENMSGVFVRFLMEEAAHWKTLDTFKVLIDNALEKGVEMKVQTVVEVAKWMNFDALRYLDEVGVLKPLVGCDTRRQVRLHVKSIVSRGNEDMKEKVLKYDEEAHGPPA
ncbi:hypothetical protein HDV05_000467 [Chytridiales sp. JEL 0842]|nr:hypothetical protein HDV05_000467 [Chytridiales sp. JEL 0842]